MKEFQSPLLQPKEQYLLKLCLKEFLANTAVANTYYSLYRKYKHINYEAQLILEEI